ncbi:MAG: amidohydrolase family protein [Gammaproteobacteria bacterium]|nr:amidohydrolase family protein [Gammaproteobacteria bacterium]
MRSRYDPDGSRLPIKVDTTTNGEFAPRPLERHSRAANALAAAQAGDLAKRAGVSRRDFLTSSCGAAATLLAFNEAHAAFGKTGGFFDLPQVAALEPAAARPLLAGAEFIFDIQGHHVNPLDRWRAPHMNTAIGLQFMPHGRCAYLDPDTEFGHVQCFTGQAFVKEMFLDSDTDMAVLTFTPTSYEDMPLTDDEAAATRELVDTLEGNHRLLVHGRVVPNIDGDIQRMPGLKEQWDVSAWKTYTQASVDGSEGWWLDDEEHGAPLIDMARETGVRVICIHKGLPLPTKFMTKNNRLYGGCRDVGRAAKQNPDIDFIVYHSGYDIKEKDGPFVPGDHRIGADSLIQSLIENEIPPNSNVYAELGTTWRYLMRDPEEAAHVMGKLFQYVGEDRVVWGTDCIWYGSPQDQIQAFRTFQIAEEFRDKFGYPEITPELRAKVFGLNAAGPYGISLDEIRQRARDPVERARENYRHEADPTFLTYGPKTRREFLELLRMKRGA